MELDDATRELGELSLAEPTSRADRLPFDVLQLIYDHLDSSDPLVTLDPFAAQPVIDANRALAHAVSAYWGHAYDERHARVYAGSLRELEALSGATIGHLLLRIRPGDAISRWLEGISSLSDRATLIASDDLGSPQLSLRSTAAAISKIVSRLDRGCIFSAHSLTHLHIGVNVRLADRMISFHDGFALKTTDVGLIVASAPNLVGLVIDGRFSGPVPALEDEVADRRPLRYLKLNHARLDVVRWLMWITQADLEVLSVAEQQSRWALPDGLWSGLSEEAFDEIGRHTRRRLDTLAVRIPSHHEIHDAPSFARSAEQLRRITPHLDTLQLRFDFASLSTIRALCKGVRHLAIVSEPSAAAIQLMALVQLLNDLDIRSLELVGNAWTQKTTRLRKLCSEKGVQLIV